MFKLRRARARAAAALVALRGLLLVGAVAAGGCGVLALVRPSLALLHGEGDGHAPLGFPGLLQALCSLVTLLGWAWLQAATLLVAVAAVARVSRRPQLAGRMERACGRTMPASVRRVLLAGCGVALSAGASVLPAAAASQPPPQSPEGPAVVMPSSTLDGLPLPDRPVGLRHDARPRLERVRAGDSLWAIARRLLPPDASDHQITIAWHRLAHANRDVLGADPDLIHPGTRLRVPAHLDRRDTP